MILFYLFLVVVGFVILIKGSDILVEGSCSIAKKLNVSDLIIGLTVIAFGTSLPELIVNVYASYIGNTGIAIGNILGSNIANILLILGAAAIVYPLKVKSNTIFKEIPYSLLATIILGVLANDVIFFRSTSSILSRIDGIILLIFFCFYMYYIFKISKTLKNESDDITTISSSTKSIIYIFIGIISLLLGGKILVDSTVRIAQILNISDTLLGLTIIAIGTSMPELITSIIAAAKKKTDIAIGNVIGSNIFNIFWILGISASINPLPFDSNAIKDVIVLLLATLLLFILMFIGKKHELGKKEGILFLLLYLAYLLYRIFLF